MQKGTIKYHVSISSLNAHLFKVKCDLQAKANAPITFSLPSWTPGSYLVREFAQHLIQIEARCRGDAVELSKIDKDSWTCTPPNNELTIEYEVYAFDSSIRAAFIDDSYAFFSGTSLFVRFHEMENYEHLMVIEKPGFKECKKFQAATTMTPIDVDSEGFGSYKSNDFDEFVDHPVLMGDHQIHRFEVDGVPHELIVTPKIDFDAKRLVNDCQKICKKHNELFGNPLPIDKYLFLLRAEEVGYGGLEHRASSALLCKISDLPLKSDKVQRNVYRQLLGLFSHEYFHSWNVKRLKPKEFIDFDFNSENYTQMLWFFEGFTSYYDDLTVVRSNTISKENYLSDLGITISRVHSQLGRHKQTLAQASFDAWIKFYRPNENSPNATVSYYQKGTLFALALDLTMRLKSDHKACLDDVMRDLWKNFGEKSVGISETDVIKSCSKIADHDFRPFFKDYIHSTKEIELKDLLQEFGVELCWEQKFLPDRIFSTYLGCTIQAQGDFCRVLSVTDNSPAMVGGLNAFDQIVAINKSQINAQSFETQLSRYQPNETVTIHFFRRGKLKKREIKLSSLPKDQCILKVVKNASQKQLHALNSWLHASDES